MADQLVDMTKRLPRGAIPSPRHELAAAKRNQESDPIWGLGYRCTFRQSILTGSELPVGNHLPIGPGNKTEEQATLKARHRNSSPRNESLSKQKDKGFLSRVFSTFKVSANTQQNAVFFSEFSVASLEGRF